ncbi:MAG: signal peptidase I [Planctomycetes bacterium]|nr:signal peptidase I [Planctomycetota bacterium]
MIFFLAIVVFYFVCWWKIFEKAGQPGWAGLVPIYNIYVLTIIAKRPAWWLILLLIPYLNAIFWVILCIDLAKRFGESALFGIGLFFLGFIFFPILAFGGASYEGNRDVGAVFD